MVMFLHRFLNFLLDILSCNFTFPYKKRSSFSLGFKLENTFWQMLFLDF